MTRFSLIWGMACCFWVLDLPADGLAHGGDVVEAEVLLGELVGQLGQGVLNQAVQGHVDLGDLDLGGLLAFGGLGLRELELDGLLVAGVHAEQALVKALGHGTAAELVEAVLELEVLGVLAALALDVDEVIVLDRAALDVDVLAEVAAERLDLAIDLGLGCLLAGEGDLNRLAGA